MKTETKSPTLKLLARSEAIHLDGTPVTHWEINDDAELGEVAVLFTIDTDGLVAEYDFSMADVKNSVVKGNEIKLIDTETENGDDITYTIECFKLVPIGLEML